MLTTCELEETEEAPADTLVAEVVVGFEDADVLAVRAPAMGVAIDARGPSRFLGTAFVFNKDNSSGPEVEMDAGVVVCRALSVAPKPDDICNDVSEVVGTYILNPDERLTDVAVEDEIFEEVKVEVGSTDTPPGEWEGALCPLT